MIISTAELEKVFWQGGHSRQNEGADHDFAGRVERETAARTGEGSEKDGAGQVTTSRHFCPEGPALRIMALVVYIPRRRLFFRTAGSGLSRVHRTAVLRRPALDGLPRLCYFPGKRRGYILQSRPLSHDWERAGDWAELSY